MDKVIIDGVDVSGCAYITYRESNNPICSETGQYCNGYDICYFKQLQRAKAENEQIKKDYAKLHIDFAKCNEENERLKEEVEHYRKEAYRLADGLNKTENLAFTYKQTLQEIRDIATLFHSVNENKDLDRFKNNILAKINEVIGEEEE